MTQALVSIGSNMNHPQLQIETAFARLKEHFDHVLMSSLYLTEPVGGIPQDDYINAAIQIETQQSAQELLLILMTLEEQAHRNRANQTPNGPRNLDLDIILFGDEIVSGSDLTIPHPRYRERRFVLEPLCEIAPEAIDPQSQQSISRLLELCTDENWVQILDEKVPSL